MGMDLLLRLNYLSTQKYLQAHLSVAIQCLSAEADVLLF